MMRALILAAGLLLAAAPAWAQETETAPVTGAAEPAQNDPGTAAPAAPAQPAEGAATTATEPAATGEAAPAGERAEPAQPAQGTGTVTVDPDTAGTNQGDPVAEEAAEPATEPEAVEQETATPTGATTETTEEAAETTLEVSDSHSTPIAERHWTFGGLFGTFDNAALRRGYEVYNQVCAACHSMNLLAYRNLQTIGYTEDQVKEIAAAVQVGDGPNDQGEMFERPGRPSDRFVSPFPNIQAARAANNGAYPPDLSLLVEAREGGPNYIHGLMTGYHEPPPDMQMQEGMYYNAAFPGRQIAMPPPLSDGAVTYSDGTEATVEQMSEDISTFMTWAAEPTFDDRKRTGVKTMLFLIVLTLMMYAVKRKVWSDLH